MKLNGRTHSTWKSWDSIPGTEKLGTHDVEAEGSVVQDQPGLYSNPGPFRTSEEGSAPKQEA